MLTNNVANSNGGGIYAIASIIRMLCSAQLELYAVGPCNDLGLSKLMINITFQDCDCPLGFHPSSGKRSNIECSCEWDQKLKVTGCFPEEETFLLDNALWAGAANFTDCNDMRYLVHNCPFDYCVDQPVNISLNSSQQIDRQCAYNRTGVLCGECEEGLSLVFACSKCKECSNTYLLLLIPFAVAGIALVVFILWLNITIATGTIYGLDLLCQCFSSKQSHLLAIPRFKLSDSLCLMGESRLGYWDLLLWWYELSSKGAPSNCLSSIPVSSHVSDHHA